MKKIIGIMGPNNLTEKNLRDAFEIGKYVADKGYAVLTGSLNVGIQNEVVKGAKESNGLTIKLCHLMNQISFQNMLIHIITNMRK